MNNLVERAAEVVGLVEKSRQIERGDARTIAGIQLSKDLCGAGEWGTSLQVAISLIGRLLSDEERLECEFIAADCELGMERFDEALNRLGRIGRTVQDQGWGGSGQWIQRIQVAKAKALVGRGQVEEAAGLLRATYAQLLGLPDSALLGWCACNLGNVAWSQGDLAGAIRRYREAIVSAERVGDRRLLATSLRNIGLVHRQECRWRQAQEELEQSLQAWSEIQNSTQLGHVARSLCVLFWKQGQLDRSARESERSLAIAKSAGMVKATDSATLAFGCVELHAGDYQNASERFGEIVVTTSSRGHSRPALLASEYLGDVHLEQGQAAEALKHYDEVWPKAMALVPKGDIVAELRRRRAECYLLLGRNEEAYAAAREGLDHCRELGDRYEEAATYRVLALSAAAVGKPDEARQHFTQGFAYYDDIETPYEWGKLWMAYGDWLSGATSGPFANREGAREAFLAARDHFAHMGARAKLREAESRLASLKSAEVHVGSATSTPVAAPSLRAPRRPTAHRALEARRERAWHEYYVVSQHEPLLNLLDRATKLSKSDAPILITGETGTGKELIAAGIHRHSGLKGGYVPVNCAAVPREMIESELFGHVRGAFSGAVSERAGLVEMAAGGTLFLDEIGEMSEAMQAKFLRFLESGEYRRVGESVNRRVTTRLIAATNVPREELRTTQKFRSDLYWRIGQGLLEVPALRHRAGDVPLLVEHFLRIEARKMSKPSLTISDPARLELDVYGWPGNVRELVGVMRRAVALAEQTIEAEHLDLAPARDVAVTLTEELAATERVKLARAMKEHRNSPTLAARALGIPRTTLLMKLKRYGMR